MPPHPKPHYHITATDQTPTITDNYTIAQFTYNQFIQDKTNQEIPLGYHTPKRTYYQDGTMIRLITCTKNCLTNITFDPDQIETQHQKDLAAMPQDDDSPSFQGRG